MQEHTFPHGLWLQNKLYILIQSEFKYFPPQLLFITDGKTYRHNLRILLEWVELENFLSQQFETATLGGKMWQNKAMLSVSTEIMLCINRG